MKTVMIIDDEDDARTLLKFYISRHKEFTIIGEAASGTEAVSRINELRPDIIFLDIQMPGLNGFEVITQLEEIPEIVFTTAYDHYAVKAFEVHAVDYLLKPYGQSRFENAISRILKNQKNLISLTEGLLEKQSGISKKIIVHKGNRKLMVKVSDIMCGEAFGDYTRIFTQNEEFLTTKGIGYLMEHLDKQLFIRLHRSYFVNREYMKELVKEKRHHFVLMENQMKVNISDSYLPLIKKLLF